MRGPPGRGNLPRRPRKRVGSSGGPGVGSNPRDRYSGKLSRKGSGPSRPVREKNARSGEYQQAHVGYICSKLFAT